MLQREEVLEPGLVICDPHHHLWDLPESMGSELLARMRMRRRRFLLPEMLDAINSGHNVVSTVFVDARAFYRRTEPIHLQPVGETEFVTGVAAMSASGRYGSSQVCAGIVGRADLRRGPAVDEVLDAHVAAAGGRFRGIRQVAAFDSDDSIPRTGSAPPPQLLASPEFRAGFARLRHFNLSFDAWLYHPQIPELTALADAYPDQPIVLDHVGTPLGIGRYAGRRAEVFAVWQAAIHDLALRPNVWVKLGGLGMPLCGFDFESRPDSVTSRELAEAWRPYVEVCVAAFGHERCMFESNFPVDEASSSYPTLWNAFKRLTAGYSSDEKRSLYSESARRFYRLPPL